MVGNSRWDNHRMFEYCLYDYLKKNNMHETAEIFRNEANMTIDPETPPGVDVQDGFLREWWLIFYDIFKLKHPITAAYDNGSSSMANPVMDMGQKSDLSSLSERELNEEMIKELTIGSDIRIIIGGDEGEYKETFTPTEGNLVPSTTSTSIKIEQITGNNTSAELQKKERTPMLTGLSGKLGDVDAQKVENISPSEGGDALPEVENNLLDMFHVDEDPKEGGANINNSVHYEDESSGVQLANYSSSKASSPISSPFDGNVDKGEAYSIEVSTPCTSVDSDCLDAPTVEVSKRKR